MRPSATRPGFCAFCLRRRSARFLRCPLPRVIGPRHRAMPWQTSKISVPPFGPVHAPGLRPRSRIWLRRRGNRAWRFMSFRIFRPPFLTASAICGPSPRTGNKSTGRLFRFRRSRPLRYGPMHCPWCRAQPDRMAGLNCAWEWRPAPTCRKRPLWMRTSAPNMWLGAGCFRPPGRCKTH